MQKITLLAQSFTFDWSVRIYIQRYIKSMNEKHYQENSSLKN